MKIPTALCVFLAVAVSPRLSAQIYRIMDIDPGSLLLRFANPLPQTAMFSTEEHFEQLGARMVEHVVPVATGQPASRPELFYFNSGFVLEQRRKFQEVFNTPFAKIVAESTYFYSPKSPDIGFQVRGDSNEIAGERPRLVDDAPPASARLESITVSRVLRTEEETVIAVGMFDPEGALLCVSVDAFKQGKRVTLQTSKGVVTVDDAVNDKIQRFGFPTRFAVKEYLRSPDPVLERIETEMPLTVVSFHYDRNHRVEQYVFEDATHSPTKYTVRHLEFRRSKEDKALSALDQTLPWYTPNERIFMKGK